MLGVQSRMLPDSLEQVALQQAKRSLRGEERVAAVLLLLEQHLDYHVYLEIKLIHPVPVVELESADHLGHRVLERYVLH